MNEVLTFGLVAFTAFFTLMNPIGVMPVFMTMTSELEPQHRVRTAQKACLTSFITLLLFAFTGQLLFKFFGISVDSFRIVGGIIFFLMGMDMLQARLGKVKIRDSEIKTYVSDISVTPLAIPMISGPGSITNAIVMMEDADSAAKKVVLISAIFAVVLITYIVLYSSSRIVKLLGTTGNNVLMRIMGLIVMVIAVEFFLSGLRPIVASMITG